MTGTGGPGGPGRSGPAGAGAATGAVSPGIAIRGAAIEDVPACLDVFYEAGDELHARAGQLPLPRNPVPLGRLFAHLITTDPGRSWIAETDGRTVVGFGLAHRRGDTWFLAFLFVRPDRQSQGIGRRLLEACLGTDRPPAVATCIEAIQPVSAGLYASFGMLPRLPLYVMTGRLLDGAPLSSRRDLVPVAFSELTGSDRDDLAAHRDQIDRATLGHARPQDHRLWTEMDRVGYLFRDPSGTASGYGYVAKSGRIGPVAVREERWLPEVLDHLFDAISPPDQWLLFVPGPSAALGPLLRAGLRFDGVPALYCSNADPPAFARYLPGNFAVL